MQVMQHPKFFGASRLHNPKPETLSPIYGCAPAAPPSPPPLKGSPFGMVGWFGLVWRSLTLPCPLSDRVFGVGGGGQNAQHNHKPCIPRDP